MSRLLFLLAVLLLLVRLSVAQVSPAGFCHLNGIATGSNRVSEASLVMIRNRATTFGQTASGSGTRYTYINDATVARARSGSQSVLAALQPPAVTVSDRVRRVEVAVSIQRPVTVVVKRNQTAGIGTVRIDPEVRRSVSVVSYIDARNLIVRRQ